MSHFLAYILQFQEIIVYKIPPGGEEVYHVSNALEKSLNVQSQ